PCPQGVTAQPNSRRSFSPVLSVAMMLHADKMWWLRRAKSIRPLFIPSCATNAIVRCGELPIV
ncbi:hypothetical protein ACFXO7_27010, partial [Nocardia tengchongensis]|uniref:hypothetical protein n=1 Tax=Nocardia tengchongensis TaxID=2055889 RepID=UPI0036744B16